MHDVKRIEIIANSFELAKLLAALDQSGVHNYVVNRNVSGKQLHAGKEDLDTMLGDNVYIVAFCAPDLLRSVIESIRPLLNRFGGGCHITDAIEVRSIKCIEEL